MKQLTPTPIRIPYPKSPVLQLKINAGPCSLALAPGFGNTWISGRYWDPRDLAPLTIRENRGTVLMTIGDTLRSLIQRRFHPTLQLSFGRMRPFALSIVTGDQDNQIDFGFLPLTSLEIQTGAGQQVINFSGANPQQMRMLRIATEAGSVQIQNIANANSSQVSLRGDANHCQLDFSGGLQQNTDVFINMDITSVAVALPSNTAVKISSDAVCNGSQMADFVYRENTYWNKNAVNQQGPLLQIHHAAALGSICVRSA